MKKTFLIGSLIGLFFMLFLATTVSAAPTIYVNNTFVNCSIGHSFNVTAGVTGNNLSITATNISESGPGTCDNIANSTSRGYFNSTWNCSGTALQLTDIIIGFTNVSGDNNYVQTNPSSNTYPNQAPTINSGTTITIDSHESSDTATVSASDLDDDSLTYNVTAEGDSSLATCDISGTTLTLTATRVNDSATEDTYCIVTVSDGAENASTNFTIEVNRKSMLEIDDLDVYVDGERHSGLDDGDTINEESKPGSTVKFDFVIKSLFDDDNEDEEDIEIEDIEIIVTIKNIDDDGDDDLEEDVKAFDLDADEESSTKSVEFDIPLDVDKGDYEVQIVVEGEDSEYSEEHRVEWTLTLEVEKDNDDIRLERAEFDQSTLSCDRETRLNVKLVNFGSRDQDEIILTIENAALGINIKEEDIEIDDEDDLNKYYTIIVPNDVPPGTYKVETKIYYDQSDYDDNEFDLDNGYGSTDIIISKCAVTTPTEEEEEEEEEVSPSVGSTIEGQEATTGSEVTNEISFQDTSLYLVLLVATVVILGLILLVMFFKLISK